MYQSHIDAIRYRLNKAQKILVTSHKRADGDAVGSVLGLGLSLESAGKTVQMVLVDGVPAPFRFLSGSERVSQQNTNGNDLSIILDCSDLQRIGIVLDNPIPDINIDHHVTNLNFGKINLVMPEIAATAAILAEYMPVWDLPVTKPVAEALLNGIVSDTLGFRTSNVSPKILRLAANLMETGANLPEIYEKALTKRSLEAAHYWGLGLEPNKLVRNGRLLWTTLTLQDRATASYPGNDDADLVNILSTIDDCDIVVLFVEQKNSHVKVSWRARSGFDVSKLALQFGGGGHPAAAGADIPGTMEDVREAVLSLTEKMLDNKENMDINQINQPL